MPNSTAAKNAHSMPILNEEFNNVKADPDNILNFLKI